MYFWLVMAGALLHAAFMILEMYPWGEPLLLALVAQRALGPQDKFKEGPQRKLVATIVHNAGIYNAILAGGFFWALTVGPGARDTVRVLMAGAALAGCFGTVTLRPIGPNSIATGVQALLGVCGFLFL
jgi:uncharacterized membrane protein